MLSRRQLMSGLASLVAFGSRSWTVSAKEVRWKPGRLTLHGQVNKAMFVPLVGETFTVSSGMDRVWIQLIEVADGPPSTVSEQFSLMFQGPHDPALADGSYTVGNHTAGTMMMFLKLSGHDGHHLFYEAPFNLLL